MTRRAASSTCAAATSSCSTLTTKSFAASRLYRILSRAVSCLPGAFTVYWQLCFVRRLDCLFGCISLSVRVVIGRRVGQVRRFQLLRVGHAHGQAGQLPRGSRQPCLVPRRGPGRRSALHGQVPQHLCRMHTRRCTSLLLHAYAARSCNPQPSSPSLLSAGCAARVAAVVLMRVAAFVRMFVRSLAVGIRSSSCGLEMASHFAGRSCGLIESVWGKRWITFSEALTAFSRLAQCVGV